MSHDQIKILFLVNGRIRKLNKFKKLLLTTKLPDYEVVITKQAKTAVEIAKSRCNDFTHLIAVGGDGTIHEVINGVMQGIDNNAGPVISLIPAGTANDLAKSLSFPANVSQLMKAIKYGYEISVDVGEMNVTNQEGNTVRHWFINIADAGLGPAVVEEVNNQHKKLNANIAFFKAIIKTFRNYQNIPVTCQTDSWSWEGPIKMFVMANGKYFGSGLCIAPHAELTNGKLAVTIGGDISSRDYILNLPRLKMRKTINHPHLFYKEANEIKLTSPQRCPIEADGELIGFTPLNVSILPGRLRFLTLSK